MSRHLISAICPLLSLQLSPFFRNPLVQILALKLGKLRSEQRDTALNVPPMAQNFRGPEINHGHSSRWSRLCADQQRRGGAAHPATRLMDLGRGLDPYTTRSSIAVSGSRTLVPDLNRAINNGAPLNVKSPTLKRRECRRQAEGAGRGSSMTLGFQGKRE